MSFIKTTFISLCFISCTSVAAISTESVWLDAVAENLRSERIIGVSGPLPLQERMRHYGVPGVAIAVIRDGQVAESGGFGVLQVGKTDRVDGDTLFSMGSVSKVAAALLAHRLQADGVLSLDVDVRTYLKSWQLPPEAPQELVSLRRLFSHTAGLNIHGFGDFEPGARLPTVYDTLNGQSPARHGSLRFIATPGTHYQYSGGGYTLAQLVLTDITGLTFPELAQERLFEPMGMKRSTYTNPLPETAANVAKAHNRGGQPVALPRGYEAMPEMAASGLWSSANEMGALVAAMIRSYRTEDDLMPTSYARRMMEPVVPGEHGSGPRIENEAGVKRFTHGGVNNSYRAWIEGNLATGNGLVILTNGTGGYDLIEEIRRGWRAIEDVNP